VDRGARIRPEGRRVRAPGCGSNRAYEPIRTGLLGIHVARRGRLVPKLCHSRFFEVFSRETASYWHLVKRLD